MDIYKHPGNLGGARGSILTIYHGDWPAYPQGDDFYTSLIQLTAFPPETNFSVVDDMDQSLLLVADVGGVPPEDIHNERHFHIAIWHEDRDSEMYDRGMIEGIEPASEREWQEDTWKRVVEKLPEGAQLYYKLDGKLVPVPEPSFEEYDDDEGFCSHVVCPSGRIRVTDSGRSALLSELRSEWSELRESVGDRVTHLFELAYDDTAIREACVQLEYEIKTYLDSGKWGNPLVEEFIGCLRDEKLFLESHLRTYRQELRTVFKFIRNDYMHNLRNLDEVATYALLFRVLARRPYSKKWRRSGSQN